MKMLKASVVIMGIAIIIGVGVLAVMWMDKMRSGKPAVVATAPPVESALLEATTVGMIEPAVAAAMPDTIVTPDVAEPALTVSPEPVAPEPAPAAAATEQVVTPLPTGGTLVPLPAGSRVVSTSSTDAFVDVLVENADGSRDLYTVERVSGQVSPPVRFR